MGRCQLIAGPGGFIGAGEAGDCSYPVPNYWVVNVILRKEDNSLFRDLLESVQGKQE